jgi:hypothetical protein
LFREQRSLSTYVQIFICKVTNDLTNSLKINYYFNLGFLRASLALIWGPLKGIDSTAMDIVIPEFNFSKQWNLTQDGSAWIIQPESINQIGCIHTCKGLEANYIGVIIGPDLIVRNGEVLVDPSKRSRMDQSIKGYKSLLAKNPEMAKEKIKLLI